MMREANCEVTVSRDVSRTKKISRTGLAYALVGLGSALASVSVLAQQGGALAAGDAVRGKEVYTSANCVACHGATFAGGPGSPPLIGEAFKAKWEGQSRAQFVEYLENTMPPGAPRSLTAQAYRDVAEFLMQANGIGRTGSAPPAGASPAAVAGAADSHRQQLNRAAPPLPAVGPARERENARVAMLAKIRPVTDEMLRKPPEGDWLHWRRTYDGQGFSTLAQINRNNVAALQSTWTWQLAPGDNEITPLVHDGVMFLKSGTRVDALDAVTGNVLWQYNRPGSGGTLRNLAAYGDRIFLSAETSVIALDMRSGKVVWEKQIAPTGNASKVSGGPLAVKGKIMQGLGFCITVTPTGCFVVALDAKTGEEAWRFNTIARPGEPGGDTWNDTPMEKRSGASVWLPGSYDPELDLVYFGTAQTYQTANLLRGRERAAGLYTDTTLALNPDTGKLVWHFQHQDGDVWDLDWSFERVLANMTIDGKVRRTVTTGGKIGLFDTIDAATGKYLFSTDVGTQTLVKSVDPVTGAKHITPGAIPLPGQTVQLCPSVYGGRNWPATAYNPASNVLFVPYNDNCTQMSSNLRSTGVQPDPRDPEGKVGRVQAIDLNTRRTLWTRRERSPQASAILATAGGLIFEGNRDRWFRASDQKTGKVLWQTRLNASVSSFPITYSVDGVQYVAVTAGGGNFLDTFVGAITPEIVSTDRQTTLWIFRLPGGKGQRR